MLQIVTVDVAGVVFSVQVIFGPLYGDDVYAAPVDGEHEVWFSVSVAVPVYPHSIFVTEKSLAPGSGRVVQLVSSVVVGVVFFVQVIFGPLYGDEVYAAPVDGEHEVKFSVSVAVPVYPHSTFVTEKSPGAGRVVQLVSFVVTGVSSVHVTAGPT